MNNEQKNRVIQAMIGTWKYEDENDSMIITISPLKVALDINGGQEVFNNSSFWLDDNHLGFFNQYFVNNASEDTLIFGRHINPIVVGNYEWIKTFNRENN